MSDEQRRLGCQACSGDGGNHREIIADGQGPITEWCGWCDGSGTMTPEQRGEWLRWKKWEKNNK